MLKGIILELRKKHTIIITKEGDFKKIQTEPEFTHIGQQVELSTKKQVTFPNHLKYAASFLIFILLATFYFLSPSQIYAYVTIGKSSFIEEVVKSIAAVTMQKKSIKQNSNQKFVITTASRDPHNLEIQNKAQIISKNTTLKKRKQVQSKSSSTISKSRHKKTYKKTSENHQKNPVRKMHKSKKSINNSKKNKEQNKSRHLKK